MSTGKVKLTALALTFIASGALAKARPAAKVADSGATQLKREPATEQRPALVVIAPGTFTMGSPASEMERDRSETQHEVQIQTRFAISVTEVTQGQYKKVMQTNPSEFSGDLNRPVERVTFFDAVEYCNRLSKKEKLTPCYHRSGETVTWPEGLRCTGYRLLKNAPMPGVCTI